MMSFLMCLEEGIASSCFRLRCCMGEGHSLVLRGLAFSQEGVTRVWVQVVSSVGFVFAIASAPCNFLYLNNEYII